MHDTNLNIINKQIGFIIQARLGSTRLPNKILLPFHDNETILSLLIEKLKTFDLPIILATSTDSKNDPLENVANKYGIYFFRGEENDVLKRFIDAADYFGLNAIIRVCSDNPFLERDSIAALIGKATGNDAEYISFNIDNTPSIKTHYGFWTEFVTTNALKKVQQLTKEHLYHEHVTNYIYSHPKSFALKWIDGPEILNSHKNLRLTIDTYDDFATAAKIYGELCETNRYPTITEIVNYLDKHEAYYSLMENQIALNSK